MRKFGHCYPYPIGRGVTRIVESGPLGTTVRIHDRTEYTLAEARHVCHLVNGTHDPLLTIKVREGDEWDPVNRQGRRRNGRREFRFFSTDSGYNPRRLGLAPLP